MKVNERSCIVYDVETLRNCFTCTTYNTETNELKTFEISERTNDLSEITKFFLQRNVVFVGYNNIHFDDPIINYIIMYKEIMSYKPYFEVTSSIQNLAMVIINSENSLSWNKFKYAGYFKSIDLLTMYFSQALRVSLKEMQVTMMYKNVKEFMVDWQAPIRRDDISKLIAYNINDVMSTTELLNHKDTVDALELRTHIEDQYNVNVLSKDGMKIGITILEELYSKETGIPKSDFKDLRTIHNSISLRECILPHIKFNNPKLQNLLDTLKSKTIVNTKSELKEQVLYDGNLFVIGTGGLHTKDKPSVLIPNSDEYIIDSDVNSYYPSLLINWGFYPKHLGERFLSVYKRIYEDRLRAKAEGDKTTSETLKLSLNGTYGNLINEHSWLFDRKAAMSITVNGQLLLLKLAEMLTEIGCKVVSANTDGLTCIVPKHIVNKHQEVCNQWCILSKMTLEHVEYEKIIRFAVNDYIAIVKGYYEEQDPKKKAKLLKEKGIFITKSRFGKGLNPLIIPKALQNYFVNNVPITQTISNCKDVKLFLMSEKTGKQWHVEHNSIPQQRINRFAASKSAPYLMKWKYIDEHGSKQYSNMLVDSGVFIINELDETKTIESYDINYGYYISRCRQLIEEIEPRQLSLF